MTAPQPSPGYRDRAREKLRSIVQDAAGEPALSVPLELREVGPNASANLCVRWRCHPKLAEPDELERAILELLYLRGRLRHKQIIEALEDNAERSARTIERRLHELVRLGVILRSDRTPRGYDLDPSLRANAEANPAQSA